MSALDHQALPSPSRVLEDLEKASAFLSLAIAQIRYGASNPHEWVAAMNHFRAHASRALDDLHHIARSAGTMDQGATAPSGRA